MSGWIVSGRLGSSVGRQMDRRVGRWVGGGGRVGVGQVESRR